MTTITLNKLISWNGNVRRTGAHEGIDELAASIAAHGLLQSLVVRKAARGKFAVIAGQRRLMALKALAERDQVPADLAVECRLIDEGADAAEIGLAENVVRLPMHPADQFEAFRALVEKGSDMADIAARFGVSETTVAKRLKLGRLSPAILNAYRAGQLGLKQVQAFTVSDDHEAQERVWKACQEYRADPVAIRRALTEDEIPTPDRRVAFIGLAAYEEAGGSVRRDLFDEEGSGYLQDAVLLDRLVQQKLETLAETIRAEGWSWVEVVGDFGYAERSQFRRCGSEEQSLPEAEEAELAVLRAEYDELQDAQYDEDGEDDPAVTARLKAIEARIATLTDREPVWAPGMMATAGAVIHLSAGGEPEVTRGLQRPEDAQQEAPDSENEVEAPSPAPSLAATLVADLTAQRTAALRATLASNPDIALVAIIHALASRTFYDGNAESCLDVTLRSRPLATPLAQSDECRGVIAFEAEHQRWAERLPANADDLWTWCMGQPVNRLTELLAVCAAHSVDAVRDKGTRPDAPRLLHADRLAEALDLDMHAWFRPTAANYFGRVSRSFIIDALREAGRPVRSRAWAKLKKAELAALAERELQGTGWLPQSLRRMTEMVQPTSEQTDMPAVPAA